ncbi:tape measure protein [Acinetobacter soli]
MAASTSRLVIEISSEQAKRNAELLNRELQSIEKNGDFATKSMDAMSVATRSLAAQMTALISVGALISKMDAYTNLQNRLKLVTNSQTELNKAMSDTFDIAQRTRQSWDAAAQVYQGFANNAKTLGLTMDQTAKLTETVSKAVAISGASAASAEAALVQFNQALGAGALRGEELNSVMEQTPALARAIAEGMGITVGQLRTVAATGAITSEALVKALEKASKSVDSLFAKTDPTIGQSFTMLNNEVSKFIGEAGKASGAASLTADSVKLLAENLDLVVSSLQVAGAYYVGTYIPAIYASVAAGAAKSKQLVEQTVTQYGLIQAEKAASAQEVVGLEAKLAATQATRVLLVEELKLELQRKKSQISAQGSINSELRMGLLRQQQAQINAELTATENALAAARTRANAASAASLGMGSRLLGVLGGPVGLGLTVASLAAGYLLMRDNTDSATTSLDIQGEKVDELRKKYEALSVAQQKTTLVQIKKEVDELKTSFTVASSNLSAFVEALPISDEKINTVRKLYNEYAQGKITSDQFNISVEKFNFLTDDQKLKINSLSGAYDQSKSKMIQAKAAQDALTKSSNDTTEARNKEAEATRAAQRALDSYRSSALADIKEMSAKTTLLMNSSLSNNQIDYLMKALKALNYDPKLTGTDEAKQLFNLALQQAKIRDAEDKLTESRKKSTKQLEKQQQILQVNAKVLEASQKYNFSGLESKYGLPNGLLASVMMQESKGNANAYNKTTGATGAFQFLSGTAKQYGVNDRTSISQAAEGAAKYFQYLFKLFGGNLEKAIRAYHAGEGNVQRGTGMGKVNDGYVKNVSGYLAGINGYSGSSKDFESFIDDQFKYTQKTLQEIDKLKADYGNADYLRQKEHEKRVADLQQHGLSDLVSKENDRYQAENTLAKLQFESQVQEWRWVGEERIKNQATVDKAVIDATRSMTDQQKALAKASIDDQAQYEIEQFRRTQTQKASEMQSVIAGIYDQSRNSLLERQSPNLNARNQLDVGISNEQIALTKTYGQEREAIFGRGLSAEDQNAELLAAQERYLQTREALNQEYAAKESDLQKSQFQNQLQIWGSLLSQGQTMWAQLTQSVKDANGEQSGAYKTMFLAQQAFSMGSAYISAVLAAQQVAADATIPFFGAKIAASSAMMAMGMANVGLIAAQTIAGFSTGGHVRGSGTETSDSIPAMLSDNEYVIKAKSVRSLGVDTLDYINRMGELPVKRASGGSVGDTSSYIVDRYKKSTTQPISDGGIKIAVNVNDSGVSTSGANTQDHKQLGQMIGNAVRAVIRQEQRQGGLLSK